MSEVESAADNDERGSKLSDDELIQRAKAFRRKARDHSSSFRTEAEEAFGFVAGDQYTTEEREDLKADNRPVITFNRVGPIVGSVAGSEINNRQETRMLPRSAEDQGAADVATNLLRWARQECDAEDEESHAFSDMIVCGMGWIEARMDYCDGPNGKIVLDRFDPAEALWDPAARKKNLEDAREVGRERKWRLDEAKAAWPEKADELSTAATPDGADVSSYASDNTSDYDGGSETGIPRVPMLTITHYQWCEEHPVVVYQDQSGRQEMPATQWAKATKRMQAMGMPVPQNVRQKRRVWQHAFIAGTTVLERGECPFPKGPTLLCMTGYLDRNTGLFYGLVRSMLDPQRWSNKWMLQTMHILNTSAKSGVWVETDAIEDVRDVEKNHAKPGSVTVLNPGGLGKIREKQAMGLPSGFAQMMQMAISAVPETTGINREMLGLVDREQAGVLEQQRKTAGQAILQPLWDGRRRYHKRLGALLLYFIRTYIPRDAQIRIMGEDGTPEFLNAALLPDAVDFDVVVDESPTSPNQKTEVWQMLAPMLPAMMKMGVPGQVFIELLQFSPLPASTVGKIKEALAQQQQPEQGQDDGKAQAEQAKTQAHVEAVQMRTHADVQSKQQRTAADIQLMQAKAEAAAQLALRRQQDDVALEIQKVLAGGYAVH